MSLIIDTLVFNAFQVNTYLVYAENGECLIVDAACYTPGEEEQLSKYITDHNLKPIKHINTHCHVDHVLGNNFVFKTYGLKPEFFKEGLFFLESYVEYAASFGFEVNEVVKPDHFLKDNDTIRVGNYKIEVLHTPGHSSDSICLKHDEGNWIITGDLIFEDSIGRTDLPTANLETLLNSIHQRIFVLADDNKLYPGHGRPTSVGYEKNNNPFL